MPPTSTKNMKDQQMDRSADVYMMSGPTTPRSSQGHPFPSSPLLPHHESVLISGQPRVELFNQSNTEIRNNSRTEFPVLPHSPRDIKRLIGPWNLGVTLGTGSTGRVRKARHVLTGQVAAVKIMSKIDAVNMRSTSVMQMDNKLVPGPNQAMNNFLPFGLEREIVIMKLISHPNIVKLYDLWENRGEIYLVLEHVDGGELFNYIVERGRVGERDAFRIFRQLMSAVTYCHMFYVCHRDIKPENILVDRVGNIKLADFGMASREHLGGLNTSCGSPHYAPPEIANGDRYIGAQVDVWSCGVVLYVMLTGELPFGNNLGMSDLEEVLQEIINAEPEYPHYISDLAFDLLVRMLLKNPSGRITSKDLWRHPLMIYYDGIAKSVPDGHRWIGGPPPPLTTDDCGEPMKRKEIDRDLLSGLCTFWQMVDPEEMMKKLMDDKHNYEKVIYKNLAAFRKEQEENYNGANLEHTDSDIHHVQRRPIRTQSRMTVMSSRRQTPSMKSIRPRSVVARSTTSRLLSSPTSSRAEMLGARRLQVEEYRHSAVPLSSSKFTIAEPSPSVRASMALSPPSSRRPSQKSQDTEKSYDPFRASSTTKPSAEADHAKITVLKDASSISRHGYASYTASLRHPAKRLQDDKSSSHSSPQSFVRDINGKNKTLRRTKIHRHNSTSSWASTRLTTSSIRQFTASSVKSRRVIRVAATPRREPPPPRPRNPTPLSRKQGYINDSFTKSQIPSSPTPLHVVKQQDRVVTNETSGKRAFSFEPSDDANRTSILWDERTRQASMELSELMDEVFSDEQLDSVLWEEATERQKQEEFIRRSFDLPGLRQTGYTRFTPEVHTKKPEAPPPSKDPPRLRSIYDADSIAELKKVKRSLEARARDLGTNSLDPVIGHLNRLLGHQPSSLSRRTASAPESSRQQSKAGSLSPVREEEEQRAVSSPVKGKHGHSKGKKSTIRLVDDTDVSLLPAPLKIKKKVSMAFLGSSNVGSSSSTLEKLFRRNASQSKDLQEIPADLDRNDGSSAENETGDVQGSKNWFRRSHASTNASLGAADPDRNEGNAREDIKSNTNTTSDDIPFRLPKRESATSKVVRFFKRQPKEHRMQIALPGDDEANWCDISSITSSQSFHSLGRNNSRPTIRTGRTPEANATLSQRRRLSNFAQSPHLFSTILTREPRFQPTTSGPTNLFARLFNLPARQAAPVPHLICLQLPRIHAINEIRSILKDWCRYGLQDIKVDKKTGTLHASVAEVNCFNMLPVAIAIAAHAVAVDGNAGGLSIVKVTAQWGNRSSFFQACESIDRVLRARRLLVTEKHIVSEMKKALRDWERL